jgi:hypothetical protein
VDQLKEELVGIRIELAKMNSTLGANTESLKEHMRRTDQNEQRIHGLERWLLGFLASGLVAMVAILLKLSI